MLRFGRPGRHKQIVISSVPSKQKLESLKINGERSPQDQVLGKCSTMLEPYWHWASFCLKDADLHYKRRVWSGTLFRAIETLQIAYLKPEKGTRKRIFWNHWWTCKKTLVFLSSNEHGRQRLAAKPATLRQEASTESQEASMENQGFDWKTKKLSNTKKLSWNTKKLSWNTKKLSWNTKKLSWNTKKL